MTVPKQLEGFDVAGAIERMLNQPGLWWQALGIFVDHFVGWEGDWQASVGNDALERKQVHAIRSAAANVGATRLADVAGELESALLKRIGGDEKAIQPHLRYEVEAAFRETLAIATAACQQHQPG